MNNLMVFENHNVEVFEWNGQAVFNPYHVAECLDITDVKSSIRNFNEKQVIKLTNSKMHNMHFRKLHNTGENFLTESGVYKLIFKSKKKEAEKFQDWVTDEVLPQIRKHGMYAKDELLNNPDLLIQVATQLKKEREEKKLLQEKIQEDKPKVLFAEAVSASHTSILVGELAKILKQNGVDIGQKRFFEWLRRNGYLIKRHGTDYNMPTQKSMDQGLFEIKETSITHADGHISISKTPKVTGKGQVYFINKFKESEIRA